jgi:ribose transport system ATP-binding protein
VDEEGQNGMNAAIEFKGICKSFPGVKALKDINLSIESGEIHAIVGENGAGKSTLISILGGIYQPDEGSVILEGKPITIRNQHESLQIGIGIVYQELKLCPNLTIAENIFLGRELGPDGKRIRRAHMESETINLLQELGSNLSPSERVGNLSVASQQIVEIARAISRKAKILIMDEPTSALTVKESANLFTNILELKSKGVTILYISHRMEEVFKLSDRISILRDGRHIGTFEKARSIRRRS